MLIDKDKTCLIISCMQKEFIPTLIEGQKLIDACCWMIDLASCFDIPVIIANHKNLGQPVDSFLKFSTDVITTEINTFSCFEDQATRSIIERTGKSQFLLLGAESHISILQSAVSFSQSNQKSYVIVDAISARNQIDHEMAINYCNQIAVPVLTREMVFFQYLRTSKYPSYIDLSLKFLDQRYIRD